MDAPIFATKLSMKRGLTDEQTRDSGEAAAVFVA
jgi:hypothetical protein